jgi:hypothetical protein
LIPLHETIDICEPLIEIEFLHLIKNHLNIALTYADFRPIWSRTF